MKRKSSARIRALKTLCLSLTCLTAVPMLAEPAAAQDASAQKAYDFDIGAQSLSSALTAFAAETGLQIVYSQDDAGRISSPGAKGRMTADAALGRITAGTGYSFQYLRPGVVTLVKIPAGNAADGELVTGVVSIEASQGSPYFGGAGRDAGVNGINGSRDITATEGTGSFTSGALTIGSKVPQALKDVPQSLSVLTSERFEQQNVTDYASALRQLPGVSSVQANGIETAFYSRGFPINSIQIDGGAPLSAGFGFTPQIDMSMYDHIELLRGAAGLFNGYGNPSGAVNLVRKKPLDHAQFSLEAQAGSWSNYRAVADATSPLALDGRLRGRLVMTYQDQRYFYDTAKLNRTLIYGIAELDVTPTTLVTAGLSYTRQDSVPWENGLPRYLNGDDLELPRSTSLAFTWNRWDFETRELFGAVEQNIGSDWTFKLNFTHNHQTSTRKTGYSSGAVNPINGLGPQLQGSYTDYDDSQFSAEGTLAGTFTLFGQRQEVTIGANRVDNDGGGWISYEELITTNPQPYQPYPGGPVYCVESGQGCPAGSINANPPVDVLNFDPSDPLYTEPRNPLPGIRYKERGFVQSGAYVNLRLTAFDRLHLTTGLRWSRYEYKFASDQLCTITTSYCAGKAIGDVYVTNNLFYTDNDITWPPPVNVSFDVTNALTVYAGYTDIYESQAYYVDADLKPLSPVTGSNWEGGVKWAAHDGRLNFSLAAYRIRKKGFGTIDPPDYSGYYEVSPGVSCCYVADPNYILASKGVDLEMTGEVRPGWQVSASYTFNENKREGSSFGSSAGLPLVSILPKHLYKLWMSYDFGVAGKSGSLSGLALSGGVNGQSSGYYQGSTCVNFAGQPNPITGAQDCVSFSPPDYVPYRFVVPPYALLSARIDYRFSDTWSLAVNLENILDKTYYHTTSNQVTGGHWYGTPRSVTATLRAKW